jgi:hypothetical protein
MSVPASKLILQYLLCLPLILRRAYLEFLAVLDSVIVPSIRTCLPSELTYGRSTILSILGFWPISGFIFCLAMYVQLRVYKFSFVPYLCFFWLCHPSSIFI